MLLVQMKMNMMESSRNQLMLSMYLQAYVPPCSDNNQGQEEEGQNIEAMEKFFQNDSEPPIMNGF